MSSQVTAQSQHTFDAKMATEVREAAIDVVEDAASEKWKKAALVAVRDICLKRAEWTSDAVWWLLDKRGINGPREPRAMGAIMRRANLNGWCKSTGRVHPSTRVENHRRPIQVWRSLLYKNGG